MGTALKTAYVDFKKQEKLAKRTRNVSQQIAFAQSLCLSVKQALAKNRHLHGDAINIFLMEKHTPTLELLLENPMFDRPENHELYERITNVLIANAAGEIVKNVERLMRGRRYGTIETILRTTEAFVAKEFQN